MYKRCSKVRGSVKIVGIVGIVNIVIVVLLLTTGCGREDKTTVTFWHVLSGPVGKKLNAMIDEFNIAHPEGEIRSVQMGSYDALAQKLMGALAANDPPVIAQMYESWTDQFYRAGYLLPAQDLLARDTGFALDDIYPVFVEDNIYDTVLVTLPFNKSVPVFYYNADRLQAIGYDEFPGDWNSYRRLCEKLDSTGTWATSWPVDVWYFSTMLYQSGGALYDAVDRQPLFNSPEGVKVLEYLCSLVQDSLFYLNPGFQRQDEFLAGNVATIPASIVSWAFMKDRPSFTMGVAPFPQGEFKAVVIAGTNIGFFKNISPAQKKLAWEFVRWFLKAPNQARWSAATYYLPVRRSATVLPVYQKFLNENPAYREVLEQLEYGRTEPKTQAWFTGRIYLGEALEEALRLERAPEDALNDAARRLIIEKE